MLNPPLLFTTAAAVKTANLKQMKIVQTMQQRIFVELIVISEKCFYSLQML